MDYKEKPLKVLEDKKNLYYIYQATVYKIAKKDVDKKNLLTCVLSYGTPYNSALDFFKQNAASLEKGENKAGKKVFRLGSYTMYPNLFISTIYKAYHALSKEAYQTLIDSPNWLTAFSQYNHFVKLNKDTRLKSKAQVDIIKKFSSLEYCMPNKDGSLPKSGDLPDYDEIPYAFDPDTTRNLITTDDMKEAIEAIDKLYPQKINARYYLYEAAMHAKYMFNNIDKLAGYIMHRPTHSMYVYDINGKLVGYYTNLSKVKFCNFDEIDEDELLASSFIDKNAVNTLYRYLENNPFANIFDDDYNDDNGGNHYPQA